MRRFFFKTKAFTYLEDKIGGHIC